ncbi:hypothetical protein PG984_001314 [Apiospora sp. TS-2023a]
MSLLAAIGYQSVTSSSPPVPVPVSPVGYENSEYDFDILMWLPSARRAAAAHDEEFRARDGLDFGHGF